MADIRQKLLALKPQIIDPSNCTVGKSLYQQVMRHSNKTLQQQAKQFNLGNGKIFTDPIQAADYLLQREYDESALFDLTRHEPVFIPPVFTSNQYKKSPVSLLDYDIEKQILKTLENLLREMPKYWFSEQLDLFVRQQGSFTQGQANSKDFDKWILNCKMMYLVAAELGVINNTKFPTTTSETDVFIQGCVTELSSKSPRKQLETILKSFLLKLPSTTAMKNLKKEIAKLIEQNPPADSNIQWLFDLQLGDRGEEIEHSFFDKLLSLRDSSILNDTVILQSVCFITDIKNKKHQEFDLLIFSWSRKLVIGIEIKRQINETAFKQIKRYHTLFEERLGDQFGSGWTFFPVICVEKDTQGLQGQHYVDIETDTKSWLLSILNQFPAQSFPIPQIPPINQIRKVLRLIVFAIHVSKKDQIAPITTTNWVHYISEAIDTMCTGHNILFHSKEQLPVFITDDCRYDRVLIKGGYGTGKSYLLQQKALQLSTDPNFSEEINYEICDTTIKFNGKIAFICQSEKREETKSLLLENNL